MDDLKSCYEQSLQKLAGRVVHCNELAKNIDDPIVKARYEGYVNGLCAAIIVFDELPL